MKPEIRAGPPLARVGDVWHGSRNCGNVMHVLAVEENIVVILAESIVDSLDEEMVDGAIVLRKKNVLSNWHMAKDCKGA